MCGIVGFSGGIAFKQEIVNNMMDLMIHRGPNSAGSYVDGEMALGFRRLSIIDLADGSQPMYNEDKSIVLVFNGEIYNFMELREELVAAGHTFVSHADSEVLVHGYEEFGGPELVKRLRGMFAFVIWDKNEKKLFGARDMFGIKPFYYSVLGENEFIFASEIKSMLAHPHFERRVNKNALLPYLTFQYSATEETFFEGVYKLKPAHYFEYKNGEMTTERYWDVNFDGKEGTFDEYSDLLDKCVNESVKAHQISDVPVGSFLSGGVDSSYITACLMPDKTFSVGFEGESDKFNETNEAAELSRILGIENIRRIITADECFDAFPTIQYHMDEPQSNPSSVPLYFLAELAARDVTVVLSGEGADEIFAGYEWYDETPMMRKYKKLPQFIRVAAAGIAKCLPYFKGHDFIIKSSGRPEDYFIGQAEIFKPKEAKKILCDDYKNGESVKEITGRIYKRVAKRDELTKKQYLDIMCWLPGDILLKADKMSMAHSLELRVPFLDKKVMKMAEDIPSKYKITKENTKYVLRHAANRTLPDEWANRPKKGFPVPIRLWLREEKYVQIVRRYFESDYASEFFDVDAIIKLLENHASGKENNARKIWTIFTFLVWYKRFFIDFIIPVYN
ncbi:MAG: asparagine synthase (glutamine-hydrolyzing) [Ruminococcaceae bacterium]|nr:asparagine synthase (glutamine-hydrolyzing) [Oscillospiraceae bacterium]